MPQPARTDHWLDMFSELFKKAAQERAGQATGAPGFPPGALDAASKARAEVRARGQADIVPSIAFSQGVADDTGMVGQKRGRHGAITGWTGEGTAKGFRRQAAENVAEQGRREDEPSPKPKPKRKRAVELAQPKAMSIRTTGTGGGGTGEHSKLGTQEVAGGTRLHEKDVKESRERKRQRELDKWDRELDREEIEEGAAKEKDCHTATKRRLRSRLKRMDPVDRFLICGPDGCRLTKHVRMWNHVIDTTYKRYGCKKPSAKVRSKRYPWPTMKDF